jgi:hypothetical protein
MEEKCGGNPSKIYRKMFDNMPRDIRIHAVHGPRDLKQVQNEMLNAKQKLRLTRDSLYNVHVRAFDGNFVKIIVTFPELIIIGWDDNLAEVFNSLLGIAEPVGVFYDTTFKLGDYYVSILSFEDPEFVNKRTIPLFYMIHERKTFETHDTFLGEVRKFFPRLLKTKNVFIVTDEAASTMAV